MSLEIGFPKWEETELKERGQLVASVRPKLEVGQRSVRSSDPAQSQVARDESERVKSGLLERRRWTFNRFYCTWVPGLGFSG